jgi:NAD(P)-dependent dehydrogenase (short-subunit alcohol dehydrogenase family)
VTAARRKVAVVTGGGGGIGAAVAEELGRGGWFVVTVDPLVTLDGAARMPDPEETTAGRITAAGGSARPSPVSVTDRAAVRDLFRQLGDEFGGLDAVVNVAGITRPTAFARGSEEDWLAVLSVHLGGYLNVLEAAMPVMAASGHGHIVGVTSGSGWRSADAGAYSCAKRAVAALTWQLGRCTPAGVTVNAMSPIAETRMVTEALERARRAGAAAGRGGGTGGLSLGSLPAPGDLGPIGAYLAGDEFGWCNGRVLFTGGSEVAFIDEPRLLEVVRTSGAASLRRVLEAVVPRALAAAEAAQATTGGGNPRFGSVFEEHADGAALSEPARSCAVVCDRPELTSRLIAALESRSVACHTVGTAGGFGDAAKRLAGISDADGPLDAVVVAPAGDAPQSPRAEQDWEQVLASHRGLVERIHADAGWARAVAEHAAEKDRPLRLVTLTDGRTPGGRSRAQASAQLARAAATSTGGQVTAFSVSLEASGDGPGTAVAELVAHLLAHPDSAGLAGAELVVDADWLGLRSHPRPLGSVVYGGPTVPAWLDGVLRDIAGGRQ